MALRACADAWQARLAVFDDCCRVLDAQTDFLPSTRRAKRERSPGDRSIWCGYRALDAAGCGRALACPPSQDTLQVRPCKLLGGIHAAKGPATVRGQGPVELVGVQSFNQEAAIGLAQYVAIQQSHQTNCLAWCPASDAGTAHSTH
ncbi:hypothetical protein XFF6990_90199 [Xanthomonas citri pv. fuscans]|nr:hypothetical protein XFF6990_90199 [Xanthomonas citri pv. fuscans]